MHIHTYIYIYKYIHTHTHIYMYIYTYTYTYTYTCIYMYTYIRVYIYIHIYKHKFISTACLGLSGMMYSDAVTFFKNNRVPCMSRSLKSPPRWFFFSKSQPATKHTTPVSSEPQPECRSITYQDCSAIYTQLLMMRERSCRVWQAADCWEQ